MLTGVVKESAAIKVIELSSSTVTRINGSGMTVIAKTSHKK